jgi:thiamine-phosphate pyrophosphorylase
MLDPFYPIVPDAVWAKRIVPLGVRSLQLRVKDATPDQIRAEIAETMAICAVHGCQLIVNDYWRDAIALGATYIHLGQEDLAEADLGEIRAAGLKLGISTHTHEELEIALAAEPDYVALGPIYETRLKAMKYPTQGLDRIAEWKGMISCPLIAIGGITLERAPAVLDAGADTVSVITDFISHPDPERRIREWVRWAEAARHT